MTEGMQIAITTSILGILQAMFYALIKLNDFGHSGKEQNSIKDRIKEVKQLGIDSLEKHNQIINILTEIRTHLRDKLNGRN